MTIIALLSGLAGSVITVTLEKLIDYFSIKTQNEHELKRAFYERKLRAAEAAVSHWSEVATAVGLLSGLYDKFAEDDEMELEVFLNLEASYNKLLDKANKSSNEFSSSILLYFDINEEKFWNNEPIKDLFEHLSGLKSIFNQARELNESRKTVKDNEIKVIKDIEIDRKLNELGIEAKKHIKLLSEVFSEAQEVTKDYLRRIREDMKKYEY